MKQMPIDDFWSKNVLVWEDEQAMRPMYLMQVKMPAESTSQYDIFNVQGEISPQDSWRPLTQSACPFIIRK